MSSTVLRPTNRYDSVVVGVRLPPDLMPVIDDLGRRTKKSRSTLLRTLVIQRLVAAGQVTLGDPSDYQL